MLSDVETFVQVCNDPPTLLEERETATLKRLRSIIEKWTLWLLILPRTDEVTLLAIMPKLRTHTHTHRFVQTSKHLSCKIYKDATPRMLSSSQTLSNNCNDRLKHFGFGVYVNRAVLKCMRERV